VRLFVAIEIAGEVGSALALFVKKLQAVAPQIKWVRPENLHVTLKFLGETNAPKLEQIMASLNGIRSSRPVTLVFRELGFFPDGKHPRVFWAGMDSSANLRPLAESIDRSLHRIGFPLGERPFIPHLTLARFSPPGMPQNLAAAVKSYSFQNFGALTAHEFHLIESKLKPGGAEYTTVQTFSFVMEN
jgi:RNA 2',3'-cyclic 3'-phosphodiesterase